MNEKEFYKRFPSLKGMHCETVEIFGEVFSKGNIILHTTDKRFVKESIEFLEGFIPDDSSYWKEGYKNNLLRILDVNLLKDYGY